MKVKCISQGASDPEGNLGWSNLGKPKCYFVSVRDGGYSKGSEQWGYLNFVSK